MDLPALDPLLRVATLGPWHVRHYSGGRSVEDARWHVETAGGDLVASCPRQEDAELIAALSPAALHARGIW